MATDLNALLEPGTGWMLRSAEGINNRGDIVGFGTIGGQTRAYLLTPVPEPASALLLAGSLGSWLALRRRQCRATGQRSAPAA